MANNTFTICSLFYSILLIFVFYSKKRINTLETKVYSTLVIINLINVIIAILSYYVIKDGQLYPIIYEVVPKLLLVSYISYLIMFSIYIFYISTNKTKTEYSKFFKISVIAMALYYIVSVVLIMLFPLEYKVDGNIVYSYGKSASVVYFSTGLLTVFWIFCILINIKNVKNKKYLPVFTYLGLMGVVVVVQQINPALLLSTAVGTFVTVLMYFTIENPDLKIINELNIAKEQADKANNAKTEFLSNMSHEIRTPLNAVVGFSESLLEENISEEAKEQAKDIVTASESLLEIVNGILDISKIEANKLEIINSEYSFKKMYEDLVSLCKVKIQDKPIQLKESYDESIPNVFYGDQTRVKQIILNLLTNAVKYTKEGWIEFKVSNIIIGNKCRLIVCVEDTGIGIKKENIEKLFTKFERLQVEKNTTVEGTGLGLAITKKLVELMDGKITVESTFDKGSKFTVIIDQKIVKDKVLEEKSINEIKYSDFSKCKILVVDDNMINLKVAARLLKNYNIVPTEISSGTECIEKIKNKEKYDLILLDDMMPGMGGMETLKRLKEIDGFDIPVIALTANAISGMKEKYLDAGFNDYIAKPIDRKELNRVLNEYLKGDE